MKMLQCRTCKATKTPDQFTVFSRNKSGRSTRCMSCDSEYRNANREHIRAVKREYYAKNTEKELAARKASYFRNREARIRQQVEHQREPEIRAKRRRKYRENAEAIKRKGRAYFEANPERVTAQKRAYYHKHRDICIAGVALRRARLADATLQDVTVDMLRERAAVFGHACAYCGGPHEQWDHVIPIARGGKHCLANLRPACSRCNFSKNAKPLAEWLAWKKAA